MCVALLGCAHQQQHAHQTVMTHGTRHFYYMILPWVSEVLYFPWGVGAGRMRSHNTVY